MRKLVARRPLFVWLVVAIGFALATAAPSQAAEPAVAQPFPGQKTDWNGYDRYDFPYDGRDAIVVTPKQAAPGKPWIWRARFFGHEPGTDLALLSKGFHLVYMDVIGMFGNPEAVSHWNAFYKFLTEEHGFAKKVALEGLSRGGLNIYNWAAANPDKVACIYADAPVCDIKSWPGGLGKGPGDPASWAQCLKAYNLTPEQALTFKGNPIDNLEPLAKAGVPLLHVCGGADETVPLDENTRVLESRYKQLGGKIDVIIKPGVGHHPHSLKDPTPIVEFILKHTGQAEGGPAKKLRVVFFGAHCDDSELASGGLMVMLSQAGHEVFSAYGTTHRGERKIGGQPEDTVRRGESTAACKILGATPKFFPYPHETLFADAATVEAVRKWFDEIKPDIVVTHWPMDTHPNHHVVSSLVWLCYDHKGRTSGQDAAADAKPVRPSWNLYFNEVNTFTKTENLQTLGYEPQWYLDIEKVRDIKHQAIECLVSQNPAELWQVHDNMHCRRGEECGVKYAESYFLVEPKPGCPTLPVEFLRKK